jgi:hypothetical protein
MKIHCLIRVILLSAIFIFLYACGSGDSSPNSSAQLPVTVVSGVAATGAPILGTVTLKDHDGIQRGPVATGDDGSFTFQILGLTPPFVLKAEWISGLQTQALFSVAMQAGTVHINPLSNLTLAFVTGSDPASVFGASGVRPDTAAISNTSLAAAIGQIRTLLRPLLDEYGITEFDPLTGAYTATPNNRLDAMLDVIDIKTENSQVTINNRLTGSIIASGSLANLAGIVLDESKRPEKTTLDDICDITQRIGILGAAMKLGASLMLADLEGLFISAPGYGTSSNHTRAQDMASIVAIYGLGGTNANGPLKSLRNVRIVSDLTAKYAGRGVTKVYLLNYDFIFENGVIIRGNNVTFGKEASSGLWKFIGDPVGEAIGNNYGGCVMTLVNAGSMFTNPGVQTFVEENIASGSWRVIKNGRIVEISYKTQEVFVPYAEFNLDYGTLRLRYSADGGWSPSVILRPSSQGANMMYQGAPITAQWALPITLYQSLNNLNLSFQWDDGSDNRGTGTVQFAPPGNIWFTASVTYVAYTGLRYSAQETKLLPLTLVSDTIPTNQMAERTIATGGQTITIPLNGWFLQPPFTGLDLIWNGQPTLSVIFIQDMAISGHVVPEADLQSSRVRLYAESDWYLIGSVSSSWGSYTLRVKP